MAETKSIESYFAVKESSHGRTWLMLQSQTEEIGLPNGFIGFRFREELSVDEAQKVANYLNERIERVTFTDMTDVP